jgi:hypothetical protein
MKASIGIGFTHGFVRNSCGEFEKLGFVLLSRGIEIAWEIPTVGPDAAKL